ncbi:hypothetical protein [Streptomyces griseus]|uniref:hypothetical protein n=1 Tax=Streptomyces griseus TaxID=1911 RepID=UPI0008406708|nr:hypothetical protein [Streptomyces griseus]
MSAQAVRPVGGRIQGRRIVSGMALRLLGAMVVGTLTGLAVFSLTQVTSRSLFAITGGVAGAAAVLVVHWYQRTARLTEVKVTVPQLSELTFAVNNDSRQVAWQMFVETVTRVSTQPLASDQGVVREALTSMYGLFATTRETLKASRPSAAIPGGQTVEYLAITMLNQALRPFLSQWHPRLQEFERGRPDSQESDWPENAACRAALREVQREIHDYAVGFARLAGVREVETLIGVVPAPRAPDDGRDDSAGRAAGSAQTRH